MELPAHSDLDAIFSRLAFGNVVEGWGSAVHRDFVSLFNSDGGLWQRYRSASLWECVHAPTMIKMSAGEPYIRPSAQQR